MSDSRLQELKRAWEASGSIEDEAAYLREFCTDSRTPLREGLERGVMFGLVAAWAFGGYRFGLVGLTPWGSAWCGLGVGAGLVATPHMTRFASRDWRLKIALPPLLLGFLCLWSFACLIQARYFEDKLGIRAHAFDPGGPVGLGPPWSQSTRVLVLWVFGVSVLPALDSALALSPVVGLKVRSLILFVAGLAGSFAYSFHPPLETHVLDLFRSVERLLAVSGAGLAVCAWFGVRSPAHLQSRPAETLTS